MAAVFTIQRNARDPNEVVFRFPGDDPEIFSGRGCLPVSRAEKFFPSGNMPTTARSPPRYSIQRGA